MKTWIQVVAGVVAGSILALLLPVNSIILEIISNISEIFLSAGRYIILPLILFSMIISVCQLQREKKFVKNFIIAIGVTASFSLLLVVIGIITSLIFSPGKIPVVIDGLESVNIPTFRELVDISIPGNIFSIFQNSFDANNYQFIPLFIFAIVLGYFLTKSSREEVEPTFNLIDSLSRIFYKINTYFLKLSFIWTTLFTAAYIVKIKSIEEMSIFLPLTIMLLILTAVILFIIYPIIFYYSCGKRNLFKYMLGEFPSVATAIITGDQFFTLTQVVPSQKNNFKIKRQSSGYNIPFLTLFSKSGTALVSVVSFIVILKSFSSLEIALTQIVWVAIWSFLISFCLPTKSVGSSIASLFILCSMYGNGGLEDSYIILSPAFPIIMAISTVINTATIILINVILDPDKKDLKD